MAEVADCRMCKDGAMVADEMEMAGVFSPYLYPGFP